MTDHYRRVVEWEDSRHTERRCPRWPLVHKGSRGLALPQGRQPLKSLQSLKKLKNSRCCLYCPPHPHPFSPSALQSQPPARGCDYRQIILPLRTSVSAIVRWTVQGPFQLLHMLILRVGGRIMQRPMSTYVPGTLLTAFNTHLNSFFFFMTVLWGKDCYGVTVWVPHPTPRIHMLKS